MKYHIGRNNLPAPCNANYRDCPYQSDNHYNTFAEAASACMRKTLEDIFGEEADKYDEELVDGFTEINKVGYSKMVKSNKQWGIVSLTKPGEDVEVTNEFNHENKAVTISEILKGSKRGNRNGEKQEVFAGLQYAKKHNAPNTLVMEEDGTITHLSNVSDEDGLSTYSDVRGRLEERMRADGLTVKDKGKIINVMHFTDDGETAVVQMGGSNALDLAVVTKDNIEIIEVKTFSYGGSQINGRVTNINSDGSINVNLDDVPDYVKDEVRKMKVDQTFGTNPYVNLSNRQSLEYVVESYKKKGANKLSFIGRDGHLHDVDLSDSNKAINTLKRNNVEASVRLRSNMKSGVPTKVDRERWKTLGGKYFKDGSMPTDTFTLNDLKDEYRRFDSKRSADDGEDGDSKAKARAGEFVLPFTKKQALKMKGDEPINVSDLKVVKVDIIGEIKEVDPNHKKGPDKGRGTPAEIRRTRKSWKDHLRKMNATDTIQ